ncbi:MAG: hypothetical protein FWC74_10595, partial [Candidatus Bathyarchaeota archaeon]|nr:hypothetical protein [Candidatus Termitimicrobium sp.]
MIKTTGLNDYMKFLQWFFEQVMPKYGFIPRQMQTELAKEIFGAMSDRGIFLAEAAVGTGKTLAYLLPAVLIRRGRINESMLGVKLPDGHTMPILIATSSIALQKALITDYIPMLSEILMERSIIKKPLTAALRKGKKHYLCERRFAGFCKTANTSTLAALKPLHNYDIVDLSIVKGITSYMKHGINVVEQCSQNCPLYGICRYTQYLRSVNRGGYDFQVTNHNLFLADMLHRVRDKRPIMPEYQAVIVDEAHKFLDAAQDMYGVELSLMELYRAAYDLSGFKFTPKQQTKDLISRAERVYSKSCLLFQFLNKEVPAYVKDDTDVGRFATKIRSRADKLIRDLKKDIDMLVEIMPHMLVTPKFAERYKYTKRALTHISEALAGFTHHKDLIFWLEEGEHPPVIDEMKNNNSDLTILRGMSKILGDLLYKDFWSKKIPMVLISGTLSAAGSFEHVKRKTGLDNVPSTRLFETSKPSPFNFQKNSLLYISEKIPFPENTSPSYIKAVS